MTHAPRYSSRTSNSRNARGRAPLWTDLVALAALVAATLFECAPVLRGEYLDYLDNPPHLAELHSLAQSNSHGWSEFGFAGFPVGLTQSPLLYGGLAWLTRAGLPLDFLYGALSIAGLLAPTLAIYWVARRTLGPGLALIPAALVSSYRGSLVGVTSSLGGMFGFHLAAGAFVLVLWLGAERERSRRRAVLLAALSGFIGLCHLFVTIALVHFALIHVLFSLLRGRARRLVYDVPALAWGALIAAAYWLPNLLAHTPAGLERSGFYAIVERFLSATVAPRSSAGLFERLANDPIFHIDALFQALPFVLVALAARRIVEGDEDAPRYGLALALWLVFLLALQRWTTLPLLGPQGARLVYIAKLGLLVASLPALAKLGRLLSHAGSGSALAGTKLALGAAVLLASTLGGARLVKEAAIPASAPDSVEVRDLWAYLTTHARPEWGRVYLRNTCWRLPGPLWGSHILARTAEQTGVEQLGAYYNIPGYAERTWALYELPADAPELVERTRSDMRIGNATHLVIFGDDFGRRFDASPDFRSLASVGRYRIYELVGARAAWARVERGSGDVSLSRRAPGQLEFLTRGEVERISASESYHPFFRVEPAGAAELSADRFGLMQLTPHAPAFRVEYRPPRWPLAVSVLSALALLGYGLWLPRTQAQRHDRRGLRNRAAPERSRKFEPQAP